MLASLPAGQIKFRVPVWAQIQLSKVFAYGKKSDLFYNYGCPLALKI